MRLNPGRDRLAIVCVLALVSMLRLAPAAEAVGELTSGGCINDNDTGPDDCALAVNGLSFANSVAVSPDGKSVYVTSEGDDALVRFNRSSTGALTPAGCINDNDTGLDPCAQSVNGLNYPNSVAVSPDGKSVYVSSRDDDALVRFNRSSTGALTPAGCIDDNDDGPDVCAQSVNGLELTSSVAVSPDGASVYVTSFTDDSVVRFNRSTDGALTPAGCIDDNDTGEDVCAQSVNGLDVPAAVAVSPDGQSVFVSSSEDDALVRFNRSATGALTPAGCIDDNDSGDDVCAQSVNGLAGPASIAVSPDGSSVYVAALVDSALVRFNRSSTGALTPGGCVDDNDTSPDVCALSVNGMFLATSVAVSPDGKSVYVVSRSDNAVVSFKRSSTGALSSAGCIDDSSFSPDTCAQSVDALGQANSVAVSEDGRSVYVAAHDDDSVVRFNRAT